MRAVFLEFANEIFEKKSPFPDYDRLYKFITDEIEKVVKPPQVALFTWLSPEEIARAKRELNENNQSKIDKIDDPSKIKKFVYPEVSLTLIQDGPDKKRIVSSIRSPN